MLSTITTAMRGRANAWRTEARERRERTANDPGADALESCAKELEADIEAITTKVERLTPEQYAELHHVTPQSVTRWCRVGLLAGAIKTPSGWVIPKDVPPPDLRNLKETG
jgi:hypothetical protein